MSSKQIESDLQKKIIEGPLLKRSKYLKEWRERYVILSENYLSTFADKTCQQLTQFMDLRTLKSYKSYINKNEQMHPAAFKIRSGENAFYFCAKSCQQKWAWIVALQRMLDFRFNGKSHYNSLQGIRTAGLPSVEAYRSGTHHQEANKKDDVDQKHLFTLQQQLKKQQRVLSKERQLLAKERQQLELQKKQLENNKRIITPSTTEIHQTTSSSSEQIQSFGRPETSIRTEFQINRAFFQQNIERQKNKTPQTIGKHRNRPTVGNQSVLNLNLQKSRIYIIRGIFDEFLPELDSSDSILQYMIEFLIKVCSVGKAGFSSLITSEINSHRNRRLVAEVFVEFVKKYNDFNDCSSLVYFMERILTHCPHLMKKNQVEVIQDKLSQLIIKIYPDNTKLITPLLKTMLKTDQITKFEIDSKLKQALCNIGAQSSNQKNKELAGQLLNQSMKQLLNDMINDT